MTPPRVIALWCPAWARGDDTPHAFDDIAPVVDAVRDIAPAVAVARPGLLLIEARGPARVSGGEQVAAERMCRAVEAAGTKVVSTPCRAGVADGVSAAVLAAHRDRDPANRTTWVAPGGARAFLAPLPVSRLLVLRDVGELTDLFERLGIDTLGVLAALPRRSVLDRFGPDGRWAHDIARGEDLTPVVAEVPDKPVEVTTTIDPPAGRVDVVAFAARSPADALVARLTRGALTCRVVEVELETEHGERSTRHWSAVDGFSAVALVDRVRWQVEGWLAGTSHAERPSAGITMLRLAALEVVGGGRQLATSGDMTDDDRRVAQVLARLQGLLGHDGVLSARRAGGRDPSGWFVGVPWRPSPVTSPPFLRESPSQVPWPGRLPPPAPATLLRCAADVVDRTGAPVAVTGRGEVSGPPVRLRFEGSPWCEVVAWGGPWPADERWWEITRRRRARIQVVTDDGQGLLLAIEAGRWSLEARYD